MITQRCGPAAAGRTLDAISPTCATRARLLILVGKSAALKEERKRISARFLRRKKRGKTATLEFSSPFKNGFARKMLRAALFFFFFFSFLSDIYV